MKTNLDIYLTNKAKLLTTTNFLSLVEVNKNTHKNIRIPKVEHSKLNPKLSF